MKVSTRRSADRFSRGTVLYGVTAESLYCSSFVSNETFALFHDAGTELLFVITT
jgi:hypothetical protein